MTTATYKGIEITYPDETNSRFSAVINNKRVQASSLDALIKRINAAKIFEPFDAIMQIVPHGEDEPTWVPVRIVGVTRIGREACYQTIDGRTLSHYDQLYLPTAREKLDDLSRQYTEQRKISETAQACMREIASQREKLRCPRATSLI